MNAWPRGIVRRNPIKNGGITRVFSAKAINTKALAMIFA